MKKTFLVKRNALLSGRSFSWGALALAFSILALLVRLIAPDIFWQSFAPFSRVSDVVATKSHAFLSSFNDVAVLAERNETLVSENAALAIENQTLAQKVATLSSLVGASGPRTESSILADVVVRPPVSPYDTLVLAAGMSQGVALGMEAFGEGGVPIGVVSSVGDDFSRVTLFSAPGVVTSGWVGQESIPLALVGAGAGAMSASVARAAGVSLGDVVFVPGPGQLPLGSVVRIDSDPLSPGVTLRIQLATNLFSLSLVALRATGVTGVAFATSTLP
ncbi:MAG: rod shape-determining protein MreC [Minisyncoccia bacterium]